MTVGEFFPQHEKSVTAGGSGSLDPGQLMKYRRYCEEYYNDEFRYGQGTEQILDTLAQYAGGGNWIDLGCGPSTLFWSLVLTDIQSVSCGDISPEALTVLEDFVRSDQIPTCYRQVLEMYGRSATHLAEIRRRVRHYFVLDVMRMWPAELSGVMFSLVTAFGIFGLAPSPIGYLDCFEHLRPQVCGDGRIIGADWVRSQKRVDQDGHDNRYLSTALVAQGVQRAGAALLRCEKVKIHGDPLYDDVIVWAAQVTES